MTLHDFLAKTVALDGSDLFLCPEAEASVKVHGSMEIIDPHVLTHDEVRDIAYKLMNPKQVADFEERPEMNLAINEEGVGRFRVNIFRERNDIAIVARYIKDKIPSPNELGLPEVLFDLIMSKRGLILVVGATGSGKSTTLASLLNHRNKNSAGHIISIEDPIEFLYHHYKSIVNQREVGTDTLTYMDALENTLRQAPDVIYIGEIRNQKTMEYANAFAETGHLCVSTLHANNANQALERIINFFPENVRHQILADISLNLRGIISQRLVPTVDGKRTAAIEVLLGTPLVRDLIMRGEIGEIRDIMQKSEHLGMKTIDSALYELYKAGTITLDDALLFADSKTNLKLKIALEEGSMKKEQAEDIPIEGLTPKTLKKPSSAAKADLSLKPKDE